MHHLGISIARVAAKKNGGSRSRPPIKNAPLIGARMREKNLRGRYFFCSRRLLPRCIIFTAIHMTAAVSIDITPAIA
jgi:hypothetical protein